MDKILLKEITNLTFLESAKKVLDIYSNYLFEVINQGNSYLKSGNDADAIILNQMMFSKVLNIKNMIEGFTFETETKKIPPLIDPTLVATLIRNVYETVGAFNLLFIQPKKEDEKVILYNLWVVAGLSFRQEFEVGSDENQQKKNREKAEIIISLDKIRTTELYKSLSKAQKDKIENCILYRDFKITFTDKEVNKVGWKDLNSVIGITLVSHVNLYNLLSQSSHPTNVSVFQFRAMYSKITENWAQMTLGHIKFCSGLFSIFIADYIKAFPDTKSVFEKMSLLDQIIINFNNENYRGKAYKINDVSINSAVESGLIIFE